MREHRLNNTNKFVVKKYIYIHMIREKALRYIITDKQIRHNNTSIKKVFNRAEKSSQLTYYGYGENSTDSFEGLKIQVKWDSSALLILNFKTHMDFITLGLCDTNICNYKSF